MRLFVAVTPPENAVADLDAFLEPRREAGAGLRWVSPSSWHVTLAFCAAFPERHLDDLDERLVRAARKRQPVTARFAGGGAFPDVSRAKVLWVGFDADDTEIARMATGARAAVAKAGGPVDGQRFRPHLTLARMGRPAEATPWVRLLDGYAGPSWAIQAIDLIASYLGEGVRGRPRYETVATYPIGQSDQDN